MEVDVPEVAHIDGTLPYQAIQRLGFCVYSHIFISKDLNKIVKYFHRPPKIENQHGRHMYDEVNHKFAITFQLL